MGKIIFIERDGDRHEVQAEEGSSLLEIASANKVHIEHECEGSCACTTCHVQIMSGEDELSEMEDPEANRLGMIPWQNFRSRLACQAIIEGDGDIEALIDPSREGGGHSH
ncbi:MAG TPA: 2Fe-2S iron-sulfur cluster-binding protein [Abditibacteriaceae bacterium]|jgi:2Fe-2S ferredoxin